MYPSPSGGTFGCGVTPSRFEQLVVARSDRRVPRKQLPGRYSPFRASYRGDGSQVVSTPAQLPALSWNKILEEPPPEGRHQVADQSLSTSLTDPSRTEPAPSHPVDRRGPGWSDRVAPLGADAAHPGRRARRAGDRCYRAAPPKRLGSTSNLYAAAPSPPHQLIGGGLQARRSAR